MRAAPPLQIVLVRQGVWRLGLSLLLIAVLASMAVWWLSQPRPAPPWATLSAAAGAVCVVAWVMPLIVLRPATLRWDGQAWHFGRDEDAVPGRLAVAIDLGGWMLLRFTEGEAAPDRATAWIPAQRRGLEAQWHALRCAVYSPRPSRAAPADA